MLNLLPCLEWPLDCQCHLFCWCQSGESDVICCYLSFASADCVHEGGETDSAGVTGEECGNTLRYNAGIQSMMLLLQVLSSLV